MMILPPLVLRPSPTRAMQRARTLVAPSGSGALLSCALSLHDDGRTIAVGGENASALVFDLRGANLVAHHLTAAAGCFAVDEAVTCVAHNVRKPHLMYCSSGNTVQAWDLRQVPVVVKNDGGIKDGDRDDIDGDDIDVTKTESIESNTPSINRSTPSGSSVHQYAHNHDEINHFCIDAKGELLYAGDDSCEIKVVDISDRVGGQNGKLQKTLKGTPDGHSNIVASVACRPHRPREVISGGLDACVCRWEANRAVPLKKWNMMELAMEASQREAEAEANSNNNGDENENQKHSPSQMMNPPWVHCVAVWENSVEPVTHHVRRLAAAACGDGTVALIDLDAEVNKSKKENGKKNSQKNDTPTSAFLGRGGFGAPHASATSHVSFPGWGEGSLVVSGGNDRTLKIWKWKGLELLSNQDEAGSDSNESNPVEKTVTHGKKINWVAHSSSRGAAVGGGHLFVCDTSERITAYDVGNL